MWTTQRLQAQSLSHGVGNQLLHVHIGIANLIHEGGIGTVFQQATHQISQQGFVRTDGCVDTARTVQLAILDRADDFVVQILAHAVQALELILTSVIILTRHHVNGGQGLCIVCRKLRVDGFRSLQELASASQVRHIRVHLAGVDGVVFQTIHLGTFDFRIPVCTFHQAQHQAVTAATGQINQIINDKRRALLIGLHHKTNAVPTCQRRVETQLVQQVQGHFQTVRFFCVNVQPHIVVVSQLCQGQQAREQFTHDAITLGAAVARVQCRQLDGNAGTFVNPTTLTGTTDRVDRLLVCLVVTLRVFRCRRGLAQHVVGITEALLFKFAAIGQRRGNGLPGHELLAHHAHGDIHAFADQGLTALADNAGQGGGQILFAIHADQTTCQHQTPGSGIHE